VASPLPCPSVRVRDHISHPYKTSISSSAQEVSQTRGLISNSWFYLSGILFVMEVFIQKTGNIIAV